MAILSILINRVNLVQSHYGTKRILNAPATLPGAGWASSAGTTSADFLNLGIGPRAVAMGEAQVGLADDDVKTFGRFDRDCT